LHHDNPRHHPCPHIAPIAFSDWVSVLSGGRIDAIYNNSASIALGHHDPCVRHSTLPVNEVAQGGQHTGQPRSTR